jgi:hypothetical protein
MDSVCFKPYYAGLSVEYEESKIVDNTCYVDCQPLK